MQKLSQIAPTLRPPFLILTPVCILLAVTLAHYQTLAINWLHVVLALVAALLAHISVNTLNEYLDF